MVVYCPTLKSIEFKVAILSGGQHHTNPSPHEMWRDERLRSSSICGEKGRSVQRRHITTSAKVL